MTRPAPDPILAAIDRHRHAFAAAAEDTGLAACRRTCAAVWDFDTKYAPEGGKP
jgi:hypothetical protein